MNKIVDGNILDIKEGIICHQVNCRGVAGAGLARQIRNKYPQWFDQYQSMNARLGDYYVFLVNDKLSICNIYAQVGFGRNMRYTNYAALARGLFEMRYKKNVYIPYGIGCGLGGGDWGIVSQIIYDAVPNATLVRYEN